MVIASVLLHRILALAAAEPGREVCGLLLGGPGRIAAIAPAANVSPRPADSFELDPAVHFAALRAARAGGPAVIGHYHSHPGGAPEPSPRDLAAVEDMRLLWMIVAGGTARLWRPTQGPGFAAVSLTPMDATVA